MGWLRTVLNKILPEDPTPGPGYYFLRLPGTHPFANLAETSGAGARLHDMDFEAAHGGASERSLDEADWLLFKRWYLWVEKLEDPKLRAKYARDICLYWPLARVGGSFLWDGKR